VDEDPKAGVDRELIELLNELRVTLPGVQALFAFRPILPFSQGFEQVTAARRAVYFRRPPPAWPGGWCGSGTGLPLSRRVGDDGPPSGPGS
jgi:hypothetical protein